MRSSFLAALALAVLCACGSSSNGSGSAGTANDAGSVPADAGSANPAPDAGPGNPGQDAGPPSDAGSGNPAPDAGPAVDAGPGPGEDAGPPNPPADGGAGGPGPSPDAGVPDAGSPDAGADGGSGHADCEGIVPPALGTPVIVRLSAPPLGGNCGHATSDQTGNVAAEVSGGEWEIFSPQGTMLSAVFFISSDLFPQSTGFEALAELDPSGQSAPDFVRIAPDGTLSHDHPSGDRFTTASAVAGWPSGLLVITVSCQFGEGGVTLRRFGDDGTLLSSAGFGNPAGCNVPFAAAAPAMVSLLVFPTSQSGTTDLLARWFSDVSPLTEVFTLAQGVRATPLILRTLVTGDIAIQADGHWLGVLPAHSGRTFQPAPPWLTDGNDLAIVRGGNAYALLPETGSRDSLQLVSTKGNVCGTVSFPAVHGLSVGADGTVIGSSGTDSCTKTWWSGLLK
jgi:hypothetical protein